MLDTRLVWGESFKMIVVGTIDWIGGKLGSVTRTRSHVHNVNKDKVVKAYGVTRLPILEHGSKAFTHDLAIAWYLEIPNTCLTIP